MPEETVNILDAVWKAYHNPVGVLVRYPDAKRLRAAFYTARATAVELACVSIFNSPLAPDEFFILRREVYDAYRKSRDAGKENDAVSGGGLGLPDGLLPTEGGDDLSIDP